MKVVPGQLVLASSAGQMAGDAAARVAQALRVSLAATGRAALALSGGNTPRAAYARLAREDAIDWTKVHVFWVDERAVPPTDDRSNYRWAKAELLDHAPIPTANVHRMPAERADLEAAARDYEHTLRQHVPADADGVPVLDAVVLGVGDDGHTASLFPGEATIEIADRLVAAVRARPPDREARLTLTPTPIQRAREVVVLAAGAGKRPALERVWRDDGDARETPARIIRGCRGSITWLVDRDAGGDG